MIRLTLLVLSPSVAACAPPPPAGPTDTLAVPNGVWVRTAGTQRAVMMDNGLSAHIDLETLAAVPDLYAIGPVEGLRGEVTIYDGVPSVSSVQDGAVVVDDSFDHRAAFLVYARAPRWRSVPVARDLESVADVEAYVRQQAVAAGLDPEAPFPFRIEGRASALTYHVMDLAPGAEHSHATHRQSARTFTADGADARVVGFWGGSVGEGVFTHRGQPSHMHVVLADGSGHVDSLRVPEGATLYLPR